MTGARSLSARWLLAVIGFYSRSISPALPPRCRFYPTCSAYAGEAVALHGAGRGMWLALRRILKCAPWHPGGVDRVPQPRVPQPRSGTPGRHRSSISVQPAPDGAAPSTRAMPPAPDGAPREESTVA